MVPPLEPGTPVCDKAIPVCDKAILSGGAPLFDKAIRFLPVSPVCDKAKSFSDYPLTPLLGLLLCLHEHIRLYGMRTQIQIRVSRSTSE